jgi:hypothetical protein
VENYFAINEDTHIKNTIIGTNGIGGLPTGKYREGYPKSSYFRKY